jgi:MFS transporter, DHA1 family, multidrug resistance protein
MPWLKPLAPRLIPSLSGFAVGPMLFGPLSELYGRKRPLFTGYALFVIFQIPVGVAQNVETILICRFLGGVASSGPLSIAGGYFADFFDPVRRGLALAILSGTTLVGPILGPIVGGFITQRCRPPTVPVVFSSDSVFASQVTLAGAG